MLKGGCVAGDWCTATCPAYRTSSARSARRRQSWSFLSTTRRVVLRSLFCPQRNRKPVPKTYEKQPRERKHDYMNSRNKGDCLWRSHNPKSAFGAIPHAEFCHKFPLSPGCATAETFHDFSKLIFFPNAKTWNKFFFDLNRLHYDKALQHVSSVTNLHLNRPGNLPNNLIMIIID